MKMAFLVVSISIAASRNGKMKPGGTVPTRAGGKCLVLSSGSALTDTRVKQELYLGI